MQPWVGGSRAAALPEPGNPSPQPESCLEEEHDVNKPPSTALPAQPGLTRLLPPASTGAGCLWDGCMPTGTVSLAGLGQGGPEGSWGELPGIRGYCEKHLATARKVLEGRAQPSRERPGSVRGAGVGGGQGSTFPGVLWPCWGPLGAPWLSGLLCRALWSWWPCRRVRAAFLPALFPAVLRGGQRQQQGQLVPQPALPCPKRGA